MTGSGSSQVAAWPVMSRSASLSAPAKSAWVVMSKWQAPVSGSQPSSAVPPATASCDSITRAGSEPGAPITKVRMFAPGARAFGASSSTSRLVHSSAFEQRLSALHWSLCWPSVSTTTNLLPGSSPASARACRCW